MENKKNENQRIERRIPLHFLIGLNVALLLSLAAFEWKAETGPVDIDYNPVTEKEWDEPPMFREKVVPPKPKPTSPNINEVKEEVTESDDPIITVDDIPETEPFVPEDIDFEPVPIPIETPDIIHDIVEVEPEYEGGWSAFYNFVGKNTKYPNAAKRMNIEGKVFIEFIIEKDGSISNLKAIKGIGAGCEEETMRVLEMLPKRFEPARLNGKPVRKRMQISFSFTLK